MSEGVFSEKDVENASYKTFCPGENKGACLVVCLKTLASGSKPGLILGSELN